MFGKDQYELLDFGDGRRLERFGDYVLDRLCPAADGLDRSNPEIWETASARYAEKGSDGGSWRSDRNIPLSWPIVHGKLHFELRMTEFGHVGVFPEHAVNWDWVSAQIQTSGRPIKVLNLFAYTGAITMTCGHAGAEVVHVDSAQNTLLWARRNCESAGLGDASIRWITEDAVKFVQREIKRGNKYDAFVLDPPSYGHGPKGEVWKIQDQLPELLSHCAEVAKDELKFFLLSAHTEGYVPDDLVNIAKKALPQLNDVGMTAGGLAIKSASGRHLPMGIAARWTAKG